MSKRVNRGQLTGLAVAIAAGRTVAAWAIEHQVKKRTAYRWSRLPEVRRQVDDIRRRTIDRAIGHLARGATAAAGRIAKLSTSAESEAVQLAAARAVLADLITVSNFAALEARIADVERRVNGQPIEHGTPA